MAKRKKSKRPAVRRRRVGSAGNEMIMNLALVAAGGIGARVVENLVKNVTIIKDNPKTDGIIKAAAPVAAGIVLALMLGKKNKAMMYLGLGMVAGGAENTARAAGIISGTPMVAGNGAGRMRYLGANRGRVTQIAGINGGSPSVSDQEQMIAATV